MEKFSVDDQADIKQYYLKNGYVVVKNVISKEKIDSFLDAYQLVKTNPLFVYYSQSLHVALRPELTGEGYIKESMQNSSRLAFFNNFSCSIQNCIYDENIALALSHITGENEHVSWQNMFFDQSVGTVQHQDSWYLDTDPAGDLIGVWYALEDIKDESGPFYVMPESHNLIGLVDRANYENHDDFIREIDNKIDEFFLKPKSLCLAKGDIILWHPFLIHGAHQPRNQAFSRKSFTSHFYPFSKQAKDEGEKGKILSIYNHKKRKKTRAPNIFTAYRYSDFFYNILVYILHIKNLLQGEKYRMSMRKEHNPTAKEHD